MAAKAEMVSIEEGKAINAVLALLIAQREERLGGENATPRKTEVILASVGLTAPEIAPLVGKSADAVKKAIQRARQPRKRPPRKS
jgi:DNA-directed RNA polymerase specialized sigma24 family protein